MRPPLCAICGIHYSEEPPQHRGEQLVFANYVEREFSLNGNSEGLEYFCATHIAAARKLTSKTSDEALVELKAQFGSFPPSTLVLENGVWSRRYQRSPGPSLWQRLIKKLRS